MSKPPFSNIDLWLFELAEGNLTKEQIEQLELFLFQHPELDVEHDVWEVAKVDNETIVYPDQEKLRKRVPIGMYTAIGSTLAVLLTFVGCYTYFDTGIPQELNPKLATEQSVNQENSRLLKEIQDLKSTILTLKKENENGSLNQNQSSAQATSSGDAAASVLDANATKGVSGSSWNYQRHEISNNSNLITSNVASVNGIPSVINTLNPSPLLASIVEMGLQTKEPRVVDVFANDEHSSIVRTESRVSYFSSEGYKMSFKTRFNNWGHSVQRMIDNPIALKNFRDPHYHVPGMLPQDVNFSFVGTLIAPRIQTLSRLQWYGEENEQLMNQVAVDGYSYGMRGGIGIQLNHAMYNDGGINTASAAITYSPKVSINRNISFEPSLRFKMGNKILNDAQMGNTEYVELERGNVHDYYQGETEPIGRSLWYKDVGAGVMVNTKWFFAGLQADNLLNHKDNIYSTNLDNQRRAGMQIVATAGTDWESRKENMSVSPYFVYHKNEQLSEAWLGLNYRLNWFSVGGAISSDLDPAASLGMKFKHFAIHYNADYSTSVMSGTRALSHQVTLRF